MANKDEKDLNNQNWGMIGAFLVVCSILTGAIYLLYSTNTTLEKEKIDSHASELQMLNEKLTEVDGRLDIISFYLAQKGMPPIYGQPIENKSISRNISISIPINGSFVDQTFSVQGIANLSDLDNIYVLSKIYDRYWILTDGIWDSTGKWKGLKSCSLPVNNDSECKSYELFAIITQNPNGIGLVYDEIPEHLAKSNLIYIQKRHAS